MIGRNPISNFLFVLGETVGDNVSLSNETEEISVFMVKYLYLLATNKKKLKSTLRQSFEFREKP